MSVKRKTEHIAKIKWCFSLYEFQKNTSIQEMIHLLKYRNKRKIGKWLGDEIANELKKR
jgi:predicted amidophosphoribosyltransferase